MRMENKTPKNCELFLKIEHNGFAIYLYLEYGNMETEYIAYDIRSFIVLGAEENLNSIYV